MKAKYLDPLFCYSNVEYIFRRMCRTALYKYRKITIADNISFIATSDNVKLFLRNQFTMDIL